MTPELEIDKASGKEKAHEETERHICAPNYPNCMDTMFSFFFGVCCECLF